MKISTCIASVLLVVSTTATGCSSCAKDDAAPAPVPSDMPSTALTNRKAAPMPRFFERKIPPGVEGVITDGAVGAQPAPPVVGDAGTDATTH